MLPSRPVKPPDPAAVSRPDPALEARRAVRARARWALRDDRKLRKKEKGSRGDRRRGRQAAR